MSGKVVISHGINSSFVGGLRNFFAYRDLGIGAASRGSVVAHVIKAVPGEDHVSALHQHDVVFQMVYVLKGWVKFYYEGLGEVTLVKDSCVYQPPMVLHREIEHSDDLEMLEIVSPADFKTIVVDDAKRNKKD